MRKTQPERILEQLREGRTVTPLTMFMQGISNGYEAIRKLRKRGHDIETVMKESPTGGTYPQYELKVVA